MSSETITAKPATHQGDLAKLPRALAPLLERPQWAIWRWTPKPDGSFQKPPFMATDSKRHASITDPGTWTDYNTALAAVQGGHGDGISFVQTENDPFSSIDLDNCRHLETHSIDNWAQLYMQFAVTSYQEVTPSGTGVRIWGLADGSNLNRKFTLEIDGKDIGVELFRRTRKVLTVTGYRLNTVRELTNIDKVFDWGVIWGERRKAAAVNTASLNGFQFNGNGSGYSIDEIEQIVRNGAPEGSNRSNTFHTIVGHYLGCGWDLEKILAHLQQFPHGIGERYICEGRLRSEVDRSVGKFKTIELPSSGAAWSSGFEAKAPPPQPAEEDPELDDEVSEPSPDSDPELDDEELDDENLEDEPPKRDPRLPPLYAHGDPDPRPVKSWLIKHLIPACGHGLLSGQWGAGKTFVVFELAAALGSGQPFLNHVIKRQCGVLLIAAEGASEVRLRLDAVVRDKCGSLQRAPFRWYETAPMLLHKSAIETLIAMARQAEVSLQEEFGLPLGLIVVDTIASCAGYARSGEENDPAVGQALMNVLKAVAEEMNCFVLGVDHFGKNLEAGTRGASSKEASCDVVLACLGNKEISGNVTNTRLAVRKNRGGQQGSEYPFALRTVTAPEPDEDNEPVTTMVVDWTAVPPGGAQPQHKDPWAQGRQQDQRTAAQRLRRALMSVLAGEGVELSIPPDGPTVRMVDQEVVRAEFYVHTPADGTPEQKGRLRRQKFLRALDWAEDKQLIGVEEIDGVTYLYLVRPNHQDGEETDDC
jgi:hypothetical protein